MQTILTLSVKYIYVTKKVGCQKIYGKAMNMVQQGRLLQKLKSYLMAYKFSILPNPLN